MKWDIRTSFIFIREEETILITWLEGTKIPRFETSIWNRSLATIDPIPKNWIMT